MKKLLFSFALILQVTLNAETSLLSPEARILAQQLQNTINQTIASIQEYEASAGATLLDLKLSSTDENTGRLGLLIDPGSRTVLAVTPKQFADSLGVMVNDTVLQVSVNNTAITAEAATKQAFSYGSDISFQIKRSGETIDLNGSLSAAQLENDNLANWSLNISGPITATSLNAQSTGCGQIVQSHLSRRVKEIYPAVVTQINGRNMSRRDLFKLPVGTYKLKIFPLITDSFSGRFDPPLISNNSRLMDISIEADKSYEIAAQYIKRGDRTERKNYWRPIVTEVKNVTCRGRVLRVKAYSPTSDSPLQKQRKKIEQIQNSMREQANSGNIRNQ